MNKCEFCGTEHDGNYGSGRFCSQKCAKKYSNTFVTETGRNNQIKALTDKENRAKGVISNIIKNKNKLKKSYRNDLHPTFKNSLSLGKVGELDVAKKFIQHGYQVYVPLVDAVDGIDFVVHNENGFKTVQVKSTAVSNINEDGKCDSSTFNTHHLQRNIHDGSYTQIRCKYDPNKVNYIALYSAYEDESYLLENTDDIPLHMTIRHSAPVNKQKTGIRYTEDYQIDKVLDEINLCPGIYYDDNIIECEDFKII